MIIKALERMKWQTKNQPIGFELLPKKFTIPQLRFLYESINRRELDKRNFRKKILSMQILEKLDQKTKPLPRNEPIYIVPIPTYMKDLWKNG